MLTAVTERAVAENWRARGSERKVDGLQDANAKGLGPKREVSAAAEGLVGSRWRGLFSCCGLPPTSSPVRNMVSVHRLCRGHDDDDPREVTGT